MKSIIPYNLRRFYNLIITQVPSLLSIVVIVIITFLLLISLRMYFSLNENLQMEKNETEKAKLRKQILETSTELIKSEIDEANKFFSMLIPDTEDFFSIISALEIVSQKSGFIITDYMINLAASGKEKVAISVSGVGDSSAFVKFLDAYSFSGGRFATSEKIEFSSSQFKATKVLINFYHKKAALSNDVVPKLTRDDLDYLNKIKNKIGINFTSTAAEQNENTDFNYETKSNPF